MAKERSRWTAMRWWSARARQGTRRRSSWRLWMALAASLCLGIAALAQDRPPAGNAPKHSVSGTVMNPVSGEPVGRALVSLNGQQFTMTDSTGRFRFDGVPESNGVLIAEKPGFFNSSQLDPDEVLAGKLVTGQGDQDGIVLRLWPQAVITGRVTSLQGEPIEDFPIRIYARRVEDGRMQWQSTRSAQTDDDGQFRLGELPPGQYCLSAGPEAVRRLRARESRAQAYPQVFYPNSRDLGGATLITLTPGQQFEADFALNREPLYTVSGQVVGPLTPGLFGFELLSSSGEHLNVVTFRQREFSAHVPPGRYTLLVSAQEENQQFKAAVPLNVNGDMLGIQAVLGPPITIPVNMRIESSAARAGRQGMVAVVRLRENTNALEPNEFQSMPMQPGNGATTVLRGLIPGTYTAEVEAIGSFYVQSASSGSTDLLREPLVVPSGDKVDPIDVVLRDDGGHIGGSVRQSEQGARAMVLLVPERGSPSEIRTTEAPAEGTFGFDQVRPGDYFVLAFRHGATLEFRNPDVLAPYLSNAAHVTVGPRQQVNVSLQLADGSGQR